jgi:hypothetical protein
METFALFYVLVSLALIVMLTTFLGSVFFAGEFKTFSFIAYLCAALSAVAILLTAAFLL